MNLNAVRRSFLISSLKVIGFFFFQQTLLTVVHPSKCSFEDSIHQLINDGGGKCIICFLEFGQVQAALSLAKPGAVSVG